MGHNSVVSGHSKYIGIPRIDELSTRPPDLGCNNNNSTKIFKSIFIFFSLFLFYFSYIFPQIFLKPNIALI